MSTNSAIGYMRNDGTVRTIYCHWDGYLSHVGKILIEHYDLIGVDDLCDFGDISSLRDTIEDTTFYRRDRKEDDDIVRARDFRSEHAMVDYYTSCSFFYLIKDDKWYVSEHCAEFLPLDERLTAEGVNFRPYVRDNETDKELVPFNAKNVIVDMVNDKVVDPLYMVKLLLDRIDADTAYEILQDNFNPDEMIPECYFEENK